MFKCLTDYLITGEVNSLENDAASSVENQKTIECYNCLKNISKSKIIAHWEECIETGQEPKSYTEMKTRSEVVKNQQDHDSNDAASSMETQQTIDCYRCFQTIYLPKMFDHWEVCIGTYQEPKSYTEMKTRSEVVKNQQNKENIASESEPKNLEIEELNYEILEKGVENDLKFDVYPLRGENLCESGQTNKNFLTIRNFPQQKTKTATNSVWNLQKCVETRKGESATHSSISRRLRSSTAKTKYLENKHNQNIKKRLDLKDHVRNKVTPNNSKTSRRVNAKIRSEDNGKSIVRGRIAEYSKTCTKLELANGNHSNWKMCEKCGRLIRDNYFKKHIDNCGNVLDFQQCEHCGNKFLNLNLHYRYCRALHPEKYKNKREVNYKKERESCEKCGKLLLKIYIKPHLKTCGYNSEIISCEHCSKKLSRKGMHNHLLFCRLNNPLNPQGYKVCMKCGESVIDKNAEEHTAKCRLEYKRKIKCIGCGKKMSRTGWHAHSKKCKQYLDAIASQANKKNNVLGQESRLENSMDSEDFLVNGPENNKQTETQQSFKQRYVDCALKDPNRKIKCNFCGCLFRAKTIKKHEVYNCRWNKSRLNKQKKKCEYCGLFFVNNHIEKHITQLCKQRPGIIHDPVSIKTYVCSKCGERVERGSNAKHRYLCTGYIIPSTRCSKCDQIISATKFGEHYFNCNGLSKSEDEEVVETKKDVPVTTEAGDVDHETNTIECLICSQFIDRYAIFRHIQKCKKKDKTVKPSWECNKCHKTFQGEVTLTWHQNGFKCGNHTCMVCSKRFTSRALLLHHSEVHKKKYAPFCLKCKKHVRNKAIHKCTHTKLFTCMFCAHFSPNHVAYINHINVRCKLKPKKDAFMKMILDGNFPDETLKMCKICGHANSSIKKLNDHLRAAHNVVVHKKKKCPFCVRTFHSKIYLLVHLRLRHKSPLVYNATNPKKSLKAKTANSTLASSEYSNLPEGLVLEPEIGSIPLSDKNRDVQEELVLEQEIGSIPLSDEDSKPLSDEPSAKPMSKDEDMEINAEETDDVESLDDDQNQNQPMAPRRTQLLVEDVPTPRFAQIAQKKHAPFKTPIPKEDTLTVISSVHTPSNPTDVHRKISRRSPMIRIEDALIKNATNHDEDSKNRFECIFCKSEFRSAILNYVHFAIHHGPGHGHIPKNSCPTCNCCLKNFYELNKHIKEKCQIHESTNDMEKDEDDKNLDPIYYTCPLCTFRSTDVATTYKHLLEDELLDLETGPVDILPLESVSADHKKKSGSSTHFACCVCGHRSTFPFGVAMHMKHAHQIKTIC